MSFSPSVYPPVGARIYSNAEVRGFIAELSVWEGHRWRNHNRPQALEPPDSARIAATLCDYLDRNGRDAIYIRRLLELHAEAVTAETYT